MSERLSETEAEAMSQQVGRRKCLIWEVLIKINLKIVFPQVSYENRIEELEQEIKDLKTKRQEVETEYSTLKRTVQNKEEEGRKRLSIMEVSLLHPSRPAGESEICPIRHGYPSRLSAFSDNHRLPHHLFLLRSGSKSWRWRGTN